MRALRTLSLTVLLCSAAPAWSADIGQVLERSQHRRLEEVSRAVATDGRRMATVQASFDKLVGTLEVRERLELRVIAGAVLAETLLGRIIVANEALADVSEGERLFVLAHELAHVVKGHWPKLAALYRRHIPGEVIPAVTDAAAPGLGREASALSHAHELEADAFAIQALARLGIDGEAAMAVFLRQGVQHDTATHPGTRKRVAQLRMLVRH